MFKISKKSYIIIVLFFVLLYFLLVDAKVIYDFITYDVTASDLTISGYEARSKYVLSYYDVVILFGELYNYELLLLPLTFLPALYYYNRFYKKVLKYCVGKTSQISKYIFQLKIKMTTIPLVIFNIIFFIYVSISYAFRGLKVRPGANFENLFAKDSVLYIFDNSVVWFLVLFWLSHNIIIFLTTMLLTTLIDYKYSYISIFIFFYLILYIGNRFIYTYIGQYYQFDIGLSWCINRQAYLHEILMTYFYLLIAYLIFKISKRKEF